MIYLPHRRKAFRGGGGGGGLIVDDQFTGSGTISGRSPDTVDNGQTWVVYEGGGTVTGGVLDVDPGNNTIGIETSDADVTVTSYISGSPGNSRRWGIGFRIGDVNNFWRFVTYNSTNPAWQLIKKVGGSDTIVASDAGIDYRDTNIYMRVILSGNSIICERSDDNVTWVQLANVTDAALASNTIHGMATTNSAAPDYFWITIE